MLILRNNDAYKLLYNQLWVQRTEDGCQKMDGIEQNNKKFMDYGAVTHKTATNSQIVNNYSTTTKKIVTNEPALKKNIDALVATENSLQKTVIANVKKSAKPLIESWDKLTDLINNCTDCKLCHGRKNLVIERGNRGSQWMFIGEAPGENENIEGLPFVGSAGQLLDKMLMAMKLDKNDDVYICNTVKCRPPQNRNPEIDEIEACNNYLLSQINLVKPKIIVALGRIAAHTLLRTTAATTKLRGQIHYINDNIPVVVTYHPAYLLRNPAAKKDTWEDLQLAMKTFADL